MLGPTRFLSPNNYNASLLKEGYARVVACCMVFHSRYKWLLRACGVSNGPTDFIHCLARRSLYKRLWRSHADSNMSWLNSAWTLICGTWFSKKEEISAHPHHLGKTKQMIMFHNPNTTFPHSSTTCSLDWTLTIDVFHLQLVGNLALFFLSCLTQSIFISYLRMMETPQSCLQKSTPT
jgi:hypothetical protein